MIICVLFKIVENGSRQFNKAFKTTFVTDAVAEHVAVTILSTEQERKL